MKELSNITMDKYTTFRTGGVVRRLIIVETEEELCRALQLADDASHNPKRDFVLLGNGSNTLFAADYYNGFVIKLGEGFDYVELSDDGILRTGAATLISKVSKIAGAKGYSGLEFASGIPGSVGGAIFMNAGAYDAEINDTLVGVKALCKKPDGGCEVRFIDAPDLELSYRHSKLMETGDIVLEAVFQVKADDVEKVNLYMKELSERRSSKQPLEYPSAGSFFKRPEGFFAGKLIEDAGLKGFTVGGAQVSEKHAGFVINKGNATPEDILNLMRAVQEKVKADTGIMLEPEVRIIK